MAKVIKKVQTTWTETEQRSAYCEECGCGRIIEKGHPTHDEHLAMIGTRCDCGGTYEDTTSILTNKHSGYTLVKCDCGRKLECYNFTNTCDCGRDYNWNGTQLASRSQWGEDTNEHWTDCY